VQPDHQSTEPATHPSTDPSTDPSTAPVRVARIITRLNIGGPAIQAIDLTARLESAGYHTLLIHGRLGQGEGDMGYLVPRDRFFEVEYVPALRRELAPVADARALARIYRLLCRFRPAIIHTHMAKAGSLGRTAAVMYNATEGRRAPARIVHTYHGHVLEGYFGNWTARAFSGAERLLGRRSDALLAVSPIVRGDLLDTHGIGTPDRFRVVPLGFDLRALAVVGPVQRAAARQAFNLDSDAHVVALVGRLTAIKQPELFLAAAARILKADARARFLIAGGGELEATLRTKAAELGVSDRVRFLGWQRDVAPIYAASDLVAITSRNEGTPVALIEGMAAGVPGVCFAVGGVPDVITTPEVGVLVPPGDVEALAAGMCRLLNDDAARAAMGTRARVRVLEHFAVDRLLRDIKALYRDLLTTSAPATKRLG
jgi:glycosyltransferase involved in cell wall biosynthesis